MKTYKILNNFGLKKSYSSKFLFTAFVGTHIPLIGLLLFVLLFPNHRLDTFMSIILVLIYTLLAAAATLYVLNKLLSPIRLATKTMQEYENSQTILDVPVEYTDEAGILLSQIHSTLVKIKTLTEERNNFVGLITHDLRNPLAATIGLSYLIKESSKEEEVLEYADLIHQSGQTGLKIITDIMNILKADDFSIDQSELETIKIKDFILKQIEAVNGINGAKNIQFVVNVQDSDYLKVHSNFFSHILQNLLTNAIKFSHANEKVEINGQHLNDNYKLEIIDKGIGFNQTDSEKIFEKFTPLKREGTHYEPTTGLGLFLTKMLVNKHKGQIFATSEGLNSGATFTIII